MPSFAYFFSIYIKDLLAIYASSGIVFRFVQATNGCCINDAN